MIDICLSLGDLTPLSLIFLQLLLFLVLMLLFDSLVHLFLRLWLEVVRDSSLWIRFLFHELGWLTWCCSTIQLAHHACKGRQRGKRREHRWNSDFASRTLAISVLFGPLDGSFALNLVLNLRLLELSSSPSFPFSLRCFLFLMNEVVSSLLFGNKLACLL